MTGSEICPANGLVSNWFNHRKIQFFLSIAFGSATCTTLELPLILIISAFCKISSISKFASHPSLALRAQHHIRVFARRQISRCRNFFQQSRRVDPSHSAVLFQISLLRLLYLISFFIKISLLYVVVLSTIHTKYSV